MKTIRKAASVYLTLAILFPLYFPLVAHAQGSLQWIGSASSCVASTNIWITNVVATVAGNGTMNLTFAIEGGSNGVPCDVFANSILGFGTNNTWAWMGQGYQCNTYLLTNLQNVSVFLILGTPQDSDGDGLTDAYELLVSHTNPNNPDTDGDGIPDGWSVLLGLKSAIQHWHRSVTAGELRLHARGLVESGFRHQERDNQFGQRGQRAFRFTIIRRETTK